MSRRRNSGNMLQPRSAEITRQRAVSVEALFPEVSQTPSLYERLKHRISSLWNQLFSPPSDQPPIPRSDLESQDGFREVGNPRKRLIDEEGGCGDAKRFKPNPLPGQNRYSCASLSQEDSLEETPPPALTERRLFTPVLSRSNLKCVIKRLPAEGKPFQGVEVYPANPKLQRSPPVMQTQTLGTDAAREEFERQTDLLLDQALRDAELRPPVILKSKTPTPRRDDLVIRNKPKPDVSIVEKSPEVAEKRKSLEKQDIRPPEIRLVPSDPKSIESPAPSVLPPEIPKPESLPVSVGFFVPPDQFKEVQPESPGFDGNESPDSVKSSPSAEVPVAQSPPAVSAPSELSPIKDFCVKPEEPKAVPLVPVPVETVEFSHVETKPLFPGLKVTGNPFAEPPPANNPFLQPVSMQNPAKFVFGQTATYQVPLTSVSQSTIPNPFLEAPTVFQSTPQSVPWGSGLISQPQGHETHMEDAEMRAETPRTSQFQGGYTQQSQVNPGIQNPAQQPVFHVPGTQTYGQYGQGFIPPPAQTESSGAGNFSIGQLGNRRIFRAKRSGK